MKKLIYSSLILVAVLTSLSSCKEEDDITIEEPTSTEVEVAMDSRFQSELVGTMNMEVLKDTVTALVWVNDVRGCFAAVVTPMDQCEDLVFAGREDWRVPTADEMSVLITEIDVRDMNLNYINTSCAVMSSSDAEWIFTENSSSPGMKTTNKPGNAGLRCVAETMVVEM